MRSTNYSFKELMSREKREARDKALRAELEALDEKDRGVLYEIEALERKLNSYQAYENSSYYLGVSLERALRLEFMDSGGHRARSNPWNRSLKTGNLPEMLREKERLTADLAFHQEELERIKAILRDVETKLERQADKKLAEHVQETRERFEDIINYLQSDDSVNSQYLNLRSEINKEVAWRRNVYDAWCRFSKNPPKFHGWLPEYEDRLRDWERKVFASEAVKRDVIIGELKSLYGDVDFESWTAQEVLCVIEGVGNFEVRAALRLKGDVFRIPTTLLASERFKTKDVLAIQDLSEAEIETVTVLYGSDTYPTLAAALEAARAIEN